MEENNKKKVFMIGMSVLLILVLVIGGTYAWFTLQLNGTKVNVLKAGTLSLILNDENSVGINSEKAVPMLDEVGETLDPYHFTLVNDGNQYVSYTIYFDDEELLDGETRMGDSNVKYNLTKDMKSKTALLSSIGKNPNRVLDHGTIAGGQTITYDLRLWIDQDATSEIMGQVVRGKLRVEASQVVETVLKDNNVSMIVIGNNEIGFSEGSNTPLSDEEGAKLDPYQFTLRNTTSSTNEYAIVLDDVATFSARSVGVNDDKIKYQLKKNDEVIAMDVLSNTIVGEDRVLDTGTIEANSTSDYELRLWIDSSVATEEASEMTFHGSLRILGEAKGFLADNTNIVAVYKYDVTSCITGEEATCNKLTSAPATYDPGTIVKYKVNDSEEKYFHVISDNGDTLTMQQRENTIYAIPWYETADDNTKGPLTVLPALESATAGWTNVNDQTYTMGSTIFNTNSFTGCTYNKTVVTCIGNKYTLGSRTGKARMITVQEAGSLGCKSGTDQSCPNWMNNYLNSSTSYGGTVNITGEDYGENNGYWTMSSFSANTMSAMNMRYRGDVSYSTTSNANFGARAVVVVNK